MRFVELRDRIRSILDEDYEITSWTKVLLARELLNMEADAIAEEEAIGTVEYVKVSHATP